MFGSNQTNRTKGKSLEDIDKKVVIGFRLDTGNKFRKELKNWGRGNTGSGNTGIKFMNVNI